MLTTRFIYLKCDPTTGETTLEKVAQQPSMFDASLSLEEEQYYSNVKLIGEPLDIEFILDKLFPGDDVTLIPPVEPLPDVD